MTAELILWPMVIHALVTMALYVPMSNARVRSVREGGVRGSVYKLNEGEPAESLRFSNAIRNQNETGVLFFGACLAAYALGSPSVTAIIFAWLFLVAKCAHVAVHVTTNELRHRRPIFMVAYLALIALWVAVAARLLGIL